MDEGSGAGKERERGVWKIVNRERRRKRRTVNRIEERQWKEHFMRLL